MNPIGATVTIRHDRWIDACSLAALLALLLIVGDVASWMAAGMGLPYAGGGAVVLGIGAVLGAAIRTRSNRLLAASALLGLMIFRLVSSLLPGQFISSHGQIAGPDAAALVLLIIAAAWLLAVALRHSTSSPEAPARPIDAAV